MLIPSPRLQGLRCILRAKNFQRSLRREADQLLLLALIADGSELDATFATSQFTRLCGDKVHSRGTVALHCQKWWGSLMTNLYAFVLGVMAALTPSLFLLAFLIARELTGKSDEGAHSPPP